MSSTSKTLQKFSHYYIVATVAIAGIEFMSHMAGWGFPTGMGAIAMVAAAGGAGHSLGQQLDERPASGLLWSLAFKMLLISIGISIVFNLILALILTPVIGFNWIEAIMTLGAKLISDLGLTMIALLTLFVLLLHFLMGRLMLGLGIKWGMKRPTA